METIEALVARRYVGDRPEMRADLRENPEGWRTTAVVYLLKVVVDDGGTAGLAAEAGAGGRMPGLPRHISESDYFTIAFARIVEGDLVGQAGARRHFVTRLEKVCERPRLSLHARDHGLIVVAVALALLDQPRIEERGGRL